METDKKLLLLYNPESGRAQIAKNLDMIIRKFYDAGYAITVYPTRHNFGAREILSRCSLRDFDLVVSCGGDGTLHHTVNALHGQDLPPLGYVPAGSTNDFASSLGIPKVMQDAVQKIIDGAPRKIDLGDFSGECFTYVAAFGAFSEVSYITPQNSKNSMGHLAYIMEGIKRLPIGRRFPARVKANGLVYEADYLFAAVCNTTSIGGISMQGMVDALLDDGVFEVLLIKAPASVIEGNMIAAKLLARDFNNEYVHLFQTDYLTFDFPAPTAWTLDGEFGGEMRHTEIRVLPKALCIQL